MFYPLDQSYRGRNKNYESFDLKNPCFLNLRRKTKSCNSSDKKCSYFLQRLQICQRGARKKADMKKYKCQNLFLIIITITLLWNKRYKRVVDQMWINSFALHHQTNKQSFLISEDVKSPGNGTQGEFWAFINDVTMLMSLLILILWRHLS